MKYIKLTKGKFAKVDDSDFEQVNQFRWFYVGDDCRKGYAERKQANGKYKQKVIRMHRFICDAPPEFHVDHINGDTLDNRRENLRLCTRSQNLMNRGMPSSNTSGYKGVSRSKDCKKWRAQVKFEGATIYLGMFDTAKDAAVAYNETALKYHGSFAKLNVI